MVFLVQWKIRVDGQHASLLCLLCVCVCVRTCACMNVCVLVCRAMLQRVQVSRGLMSTTLLCCTTTTAHAGPSRSSCPSPSTCSAAPMFALSFATAPVRRLVRSFITLTLLYPTHTVDYLSCVGYDNVNSSKKKVHFKP